VHADHLAEIIPLGQLTVAWKRRDRDRDGDHKRDGAQKGCIEQELESGEERAPLGACRCSGHLLSGDRNAGQFRQGVHFRTPSGERPSGGEIVIAACNAEAQVTRALTLFLRRWRIEGE
jgi:hypothetical protein